ncbi:MAG TPA: phosphoribosyltransferase family protein [Patescibacteria group bacterium]|nr:phosphoribosyltransferase family protein [Patescibacteria group bacterium]
MDTNKKTLQILEQTGAIITNDHFVYTSGKHGSVYIRKDKLYPHTLLTSKVCKMMAEEMKNKKIQIVVGPSVGGIILSQWVAYHLSKLTKKEVLSVFTEKSYDDVQKFDKPQLFKRGYDELIKNKRVLVVEDLTTTGASVKKVVDEVKKAKGKVVGVFVLLNRNPKDVTRRFMQAPFFALSVFKADAYSQSVCPLCKKGIPINTTVGHGKEFLVNKTNSS